MYWVIPAIVGALYGYVTFHDEKQFTDLFLVGIIAFIVGLLGTFILGFIGTLLTAFGMQNLIITTLSTIFGHIGEVLITSFVISYMMTFIGAMAQYILKITRAV